MTGAAVHLSVDFGTPLVEGQDYLFEYNALTRIIDLIPTSGFWPAGHTYTITLDPTITDRAGNPIQPNQSDHTTTSFLIALSPPAVQSMTPVVPYLRNTPVSSVEVVITGAIDPSTFDYHDLTLTRLNPMA